MIPRANDGDAIASVGWAASLSTRSTDTERQCGGRLGGWTASLPIRLTDTERQCSGWLDAWTGNPSTLRMLVPALLLAPLMAFAQPQDAAPAPAAQEQSEMPRQPGETTTGRPPASARPAPAVPPAVAPPPTAPLPGDTAIQTPASASAPASAPATATAPTVVAQRPAAQLATPATSPAAGGLLQTIFALLLVLGLLAGLAWFLKRYGPKATGASANLRVVGALNIGGRERIMVVEVGDQWIVVGAAPGRVNALHTMPRQEGEAAISQAGAAHGPGANPAQNFSDWLKKTIDKRNAT